MDGLEGQYGKRMAFLRVDVGTDEGLRAYDSARIVGHPSFLILKPDGSELWRAVGQQTEGALSTAIENNLAAQAPQ